MAIDEATRHAIHDAFIAQMGPDLAAALMEELRRPVGWDDVATKQDLAVTATELRTEMAELRTEMAELRTELRTEMAELRTDLRTGMAELRTGMADGFRRMTVWMASLYALSVGLVAALARVH